MTKAMWRWRYGGPRHPKSAEKRPPKAQSKCCNLQVAIYQPSFYFSSLHLFIITFTSRATPGPLYPMVSKYGLERPWPHSVSPRPNVSRSKGSKGFHHRWDPSFPTNGWLQGLVGRNVAKFWKDVKNRQSLKIRGEWWIYRRFLDVGEYH